MPKVVAAVTVVEAFQELADSAFQSFDGPLGRGAEECFEFGEGQFDRIEVGTIRRKVRELCAGAVNRFADARDFVSGQIVHDDEIPFAKRRHEVLLDVAQEHVAVHRSVDHQGRGEARQPQGADEGRRLPVAVRDVSDDALAAIGSAIQAGELRMGPALIEKCQPPDIEMRLPEPPSLPLIGDVWAQLLSGMDYFFLASGPSVSAPATP